MNTLFVESTKNTPEIHFTLDGVFNITGRAFPENPLFFFQPIMEWAEKYTGTSAIMNIRLEYLNTSSSKVLFRLIKYICNTYKSNASINWYYEEGDDDILEVGQMYEDILNFPFDYTEYPEIEKVELS